MGKSIRYDTSFGVVPVLQQQTEWYFLLIQHQTSDPSEKGHWSFPKGHKESGETDIETAVRELKEETGIVDMRLRDEYVFEEHYSFCVDGIDVYKTVVYFLCVVKNRKVAIQIDEVADYQWVAYEDALQKASYDNTRNIITQVNRVLRTGSF